MLAADVEVGHVLAQGGELALPVVVLLWRHGSPLLDPSGRARPVQDRACPACGRNDHERGWTTPTSAARWGRWAAYTAAVIPVAYALTRFAWAAGIPLGISRDFLAEMRETGLVWAGAGLGAFATVGAILTLGLVRPWGERFPRWLPGLAGRPAT